MPSLAVRLLQFLAVVLIVVGILKFVGLVDFATAGAGALIIVGGLILLALAFLVPNSYGRGGRL